MQSLQYK